MRMKTRWEEFMIQRIELAPDVFDVWVLRIIDQPYRRVEVSLSSSSFSIS